jgi:hypothetical protein
LKISYDDDSPKSFSRYDFGTDIDEDYEDMETTAQLVMYFLCGKSSIIA